LLFAGISRWWPAGAAVLVGGVALDGLGHLLHLPLASASTGLLALAAGWWFLRRPRPQAGPPATDVTGWLQRLEDLQEQFQDLDPDAHQTSQQRALTLADQRRLLERPGLTVGVAGTLAIAEPWQQQFAEALRGAQTLTLLWGRPLPSWSDDWQWPEPFGACDFLVYALRTPLSAADLRWLEALPAALPVCLLVDAGASADPTGLRAELAAQLTRRPDQEVLFWHPEPGSLEPRPRLVPLLRPVAERLSRDAAQLRRQRQLRCLQALHSHWQAELEAMRRRRFQGLQQRTQWVVAAAVVAAPLPSLDLLVLAVANGLMVQEMARLWHCPWTPEQLRATATELAKASLALGVVEWSTQTLASLIRWHGATWLVGSAIQALSAAYLTRVVGRAMADTLARSAGVSEPDLERLRREAPLLVAQAADAEKLDWGAFVQQGRQWLTTQVVSPART
jgi:uncharacterized protein (DUF697 family)